VNNLVRRRDGVIYHTAGKCGTVFSLSCIPLPKSIHKAKVNNVQHASGLFNTNVILRHATPTVLPTKP